MNQDILEKINHAIEKLKKLNSDYIEAICDFGLAKDTRPLYCEYANYMYEYPCYGTHPCYGMWQYPPELNDLFKTLEKHKINSFLEIGTFNGFTFLLIREFLKKINNNLFSMTIDPQNHIDVNFIEKFQINKKNLTSESDEIKGSKWDFVFIDGHHNYEWVKKDFENVGIHSKICVIHDINDDYILNHPGNNGGNKRLWGELKKDYPTKYKEIILHPRNTFGIGVLYLN